MAVIISNGATNLSTASGFYRVEAHNLASFSATDLILTSTRTISVTFANAGNCQGIVLALSATAATAANTFKSVVVELLEGVTVRASATLTGSQIANSLASFVVADGFIVPFTFGTPYAVTTAAATWSFRITQSGAQANNWSLRTSNATAPFYATWCDNAVTFASGDTVICKDAVTVDQTTTIGSVLGTGDSTNGVAIVVCKSANAPTPSNTEGNLLWDSSAAYTLSVGGLIVLGAHSCMRIGTSGARQSYANQAHIQFTSPTVGTSPGGFCSTEGPNSNGSRSKLSLIFYGAYPALEDCELNADTTVNGTTFTSATNASAWQSGWRVFVSKQNTKGVGDTAIYTLNGAPSWSGTETTFTTTAGLATNVRKSGGKICTFDGYGIKISSNNTSFRWRFHAAHPSNFVMSGVQMEEFVQGDNAVTNNTSATYSLDDSANRAQHAIEHCSMYTTQGATTAHLGTHTAPPEGLLIDHVNSFRCIPFQTPVYSTVPNGAITYTNCIAVSFPALFTPLLVFTNSTTSGNVWHNSASSFLTNSANTFSGTFSSNKFYGISGSAGFTIQNIINCTLSANSYDNMTVAATFAGLVVNSTDTNSIFGSESANTTDITCSSFALVDYVFISPTGALTITESTLTSTLNGTAIRFREYNDTLNDYRALYTYSKFINSTDNLELYPYSGSTEGVVSYKIGTESISTFKVGVFSNFTIADTAYDAGTFILPKLSFVYDTAGTESEDQASASFGSAQALSVIVTPTNDRATCYVKYKAASDATAPNNKVTVTPAVVNMRKYGYTFQSATLGIKETTDETVAVLTTPASNPYITQATAATVAAYTEFTINHATQTVTITADTTLDKLYDYSQYDLTLDANMGYSEWLTTLDGENFTSTYNITLNTGVDLTGEGSITMGTGTTFTRTGTATYDGYVVNANGTRTVHVKLNGLVAGSVVQIYNTTNSAEIDKDTVSGTTYDYYYTYSADKNIRIRVRYVNGTTGYLPYEATGTISNTGFELNVSQESATVYNDNNFDGSSATEFSMTEGVVRIDVDDPNNVTTFQRLYNWYLYKISTETHIDDQPDYITANSTRDYIFDDTLAIKNLDGSNPLYISGANVRNESNDNALLDTSGGMIFIRGDYPAVSVGEIWSDTVTYASGTKGDQLADAASGAGLSVGAIADAVWDEATAGHATAGTTGKALTDAASGAGLDASTIADAVWDEQQSGHVAAGSFGLYLDQPVSSVGSVVMGNGQITGKQAADIAKKVWEHIISDKKSAAQILASRSEFDHLKDSVKVDFTELKTGMKDIIAELKGIKPTDHTKDFIDLVKIMASCEKSLKGIEKRVEVTEKNSDKLPDKQTLVQIVEDLKLVQGALKQVDVTHQESTKIALTRMEDIKSLLAEWPNKLDELKGHYGVETKATVSVAAQALESLIEDLKQSLSEHGKRILLAITEAKFSTIEEVTQTIEEETTTVLDQINQNINK